MNLVLIGMMGSGKTTVGRQIARRMHWSFYDTDSVVEDLSQMSIASIFETMGEEFFRKVERQVVGHLASHDHAVIATGGGAPCQPENWKAFQKRSLVVWLKARPESLLERLRKSQQGSRPLLKDDLSLEKISSLLSKRESFYRKAQFILDTDGLPPDRIADKIWGWARSKRLK
jgi:shikimate kinase